MSVVRAGRDSSWRIALVVMLVVFAALGSWSLMGTGPSAAWAQADGAAPAPAPAGAAAPAGADDESLLMYYLKALGWLYTPVFLILSFILVALLIMNFLAARRDNIVPLTLVEGFEQLVTEKKFQDAYDLAKADDSFLGKVLAAGMAKLQGGFEHASAAMQETGIEENMKHEHRLGYIAMIGAISPMFGLLGTVDGMVASFRVIAEKTTAPSPKELATGVATALITTLVGLWLAIPSIIFYGLLRNRFSKLMNEVGVVSEDLMAPFKTVKPKP